MSETKEPVKKKFLLLLLEGIEQYGMELDKFYSHINRTKQASNYHLKKLKSVGFIKKEQSYPFAIYSLTPLGQSVKRIFTQSEGMPDLWRCHNLIVGFQIENFGSFNWSNYKLKQMKNWSYAREIIKDSEGEWTIDIQTTKLLKIYCPEKYHDNPDVAFGKMYDIASRLARKYEDIYSMKIGLMKIIREGHKEKVNSELLGKLFGRRKIYDVWADASLGTMNMEENQSSKKLEDLLNLPERIIKLEDHQIRQTEIMDKFSKNLELHLAVLLEIRDAIRRLGK